MEGFTATWQDGVLRLSGELDLATEEDLLIAFRSGSNDGPGIRAFVTIAKEASPRGVVLRSPRRAVRMVINLTRVEDAAAVRVDN